MVKSNSGLAVLREPSGVVQMERGPDPTSFKVRSHPLRIVHRRQKDQSQRRRDNVYQRLRTSYQEEILRPIKKTIRAGTSR